MKKINDTLTAEELAKFAKHNRDQAACFPEYSEFFSKRADAARVILSCFWSCEVAENLLDSVSTSWDEWVEPVDDYELSEEMELPDFPWEE